MLLFSGRGAQAQRFNPRDHFDSNDCMRVWTPEAAITSHQDGDVVAVGAAVVLMGAVSDSDGAAQSMTVAWTIDGQDACPDAEP